MTSRSSVVKFNAEIPPELQFHDFNHDEVDTLNTSESFANCSEGLNFDEAEGLSSNRKERASSCWDFSYYQSFFNIDTDQALQRMLWSMIPFAGQATYLDRKIRPTPDLYGPFWISTTLVLTTAISANIASFLRSEGQNKLWHYCFHKVFPVAIAIYAYVFLLPIVIWTLMRYRQNPAKYALVEILCVYGYSLFIYIPMSILWVIPVAWFQWFLVWIGATLSGLVLMQTFLPVVKNENKKTATIVLGLIMLFHVLLAVGFMTYFFQPPHGHFIMPSSAVGQLTPNKYKAKHGRQQNKLISSVPNHIMKETKFHGSKLVLKQSFDTKHITVKNPLVNNVDFSKIGTDHF